MSAIELTFYVKPESFQVGGTQRGTRRYPAKKAEKFKQDIYQLARSQMIKKKHKKLKFPAKISVSIVIKGAKELLGKPAPTSYDVDNILKPICDALAPALLESGNDRDFRKETVLAVYGSENHIFVMAGDFYECKDWDD